MDESEHIIKKIVLSVATDNGIDNNIVLECIGSIIDDDEAFRCRKISRNSKIKTFTDVIVPSMKDGTFKDHFGMMRSTFEDLYNILQTYESGNCRIDLKIKMMVILWLLVTTDSYGSVALRFGISKGTAHYIVDEMVNWMVLLKEEFINWPTMERMSEISKQFVENCGLPNIVGAIDGTIIPIKEKNRQPSVHAVRLQAICDDKSLFTDIYIGIPGRLHDARVWDLCPVKRKLYNILRPKEYIVGDEAYPLEEILMKPYLTNGYLTADQINFNTALSSAHRAVGRAIDLLKDKWRRLKFFDITSHERIRDTISTCCVLHNFIIIKEGIGQFDDDTLNLSTEEFSTRENDQGRIMREYLTNLIANR